MDLCGGSSCLPESLWSCQSLSCKAPLKALSIHAVSLTTGLLSPQVFMPFLLPALCDLHTVPYSLGCKWERQLSLLSVCRTQIIVQKPCGSTFAQKSGSVVGLFFPRLFYPLEAFSAGLCGATPLISRKPQILSRGCGLGSFPGGPEPSLHIYQLDPWRLKPAQNVTG